jgi:hypothetical protein
MLKVWAQCAPQGEAGPQAGRGPASENRLSLPPSIEGLVPYEPGKPIRRCSGSSGWGASSSSPRTRPDPPFPAALEAMQRAALELSRYRTASGRYGPTGRAASFGLIIGEQTGSSTCRAGDPCPGDEVVCGWPSFPSCVSPPRSSAPVSNRSTTYDLDGSPRSGRGSSRLPPEQPDRHCQRPGGAARVPRPRAEHVLCVSGQALSASTASSPTGSSLPRGPPDRRAAHVSNLRARRAQVGWAAAPAASPSRRARWRAVTSPPRRRRPPLWPRRHRRSRGGRS